MLLIAVVVLFSCSGGTDVNVPVNPSDFTVKATSRGLSITGYKGDCPDGNLVIPAQIEGKDVVAIESRAFANNEKIRKVVIPETIEEIGDAILNGCLNLENLEVLPGNIHFTSEGNCVVRVKDSMLILGCKNSIIPDSAKIIGQWAFNGVKGLKKLVIGPGVEKILYFAFTGMEDLEEIVFSSSVNDIGRSIFMRCNNLRKITVLPGNKIYSSEGNCILKNDGDKKILVAGCAGSIIPDDVTVIANGAFHDIESLREINIPEGVKTIEHAAFTGSGLDKIHIPASVENLAQKAFLMTPNLKEITVADGNVRYKAEGNCLIDTKSKLGKTGKLEEVAIMQGCRNSKIPEGVEVIAESAFERISIESVDFPSTLKVICGRAFAESGLTNMPKLPSSLLILESGVFAGLPFEAEIPKELAWAWQEYEEGETVGLILNRYSGSSSSVEIPSELNGKKVLAIGERAFSDNDNVKAIHIPDSVINIEKAALYGAYELSEITVDEANKKYHVENDCLIETETGRLIQGLDNGNIPEGVKIIDECAFKERFNIKKISLPSTLKRIEGYGLDCLRGLEESYVIPASVEYVGPNGCTRYSNSTVEIKIDNTEEYVKNNWDKDWCGGREDHITYVN